MTYQLTIAPDMNEGDKGILISLFETTGTVAKIKRYNKGEYSKAQKIYSVGNRVISLKHSLIKLSKAGVVPQVWAPLEGTVGHGGFGRVYKTDSIVLYYPKNTKFVGHDLEAQLIVLSAPLAIKKIQDASDHAASLEAELTTTMYDVHWHTTARYNDKTAFYLTLPWLGMNAKDYLNERTLSEPEKDQFCLAMLLAYQDFRGRTKTTVGKYLHRDLKLENFTVMDGRIALIDFGFSAQVGENNDKLHFTLANKPPEFENASSLKGYPYSEKSDLYSLAVDLKAIHQQGKESELNTNKESELNTNDALELLMTSSNGGSLGDERTLKEMGFYGATPPSSCGSPPSFSSQMDECSDSDTELDNNESDTVDEEETFESKRQYQAREEFIQKLLDGKPANRPTLKEAINFFSLQCNLAEITYSPDTKQFATQLYDKVITGELDNGKLQESWKESEPKARQEHYKSYREIHRLLSQEKLKLVATPNPSPQALDAVSNINTVLNQKEIMSPLKKHRSEAQIWVNKTDGLPVVGPLFKPARKDTTRSEDNLAELRQELGNEKPFDLNQASMVKIPKRPEKQEITFWPWHGCF